MTIKEENMLCKKQGKNDDLSMKVRENSNIYIDIGWIRLFKNNLLKI